MGNEIIGLFIFFILVVSIPILWSIYAKNIVIAFLASLISVVFIIQLSSFLSPTGFELMSLKHFLTVSGIAGSISLFSAFIIKAKQWFNVRSKIKT